jgi:hypothetical protein
MKNIKILFVFSLLINTIQAQVLITPDNQGIGTSIPYSSRLTLDGKDITNEVLSLKSDASPSMIFYTPMVNSFVNRAGYVGVSIFEDGSFFDVGSYANSNLGLSLLSNGNRKIYIKPNGNIGMGFNPLFPNAPVHIFSPEFISEALRLETTDAATNPVMTFYRQSSKLGQIGAATGTTPDIALTSNVAGITFNTSGLAMKIGSNGNIGMPTVSPFRKLNITGRVNIDAGSLEFNSFGGNSGDILYSGGVNSSPTWAAPPAIPVIPKYAVSASSGSQIFNYNPTNDQYLNFGTESFDDGNLLSGGVFTARHTGVYEVTLEMLLLSYNQSSSSLEFRVWKNNFTPPAYFTDYVSNEIHGWANNVNVSVFGSVERSYHQYHELFKLNNGDTLHFMVYNNGLNPITLNSRIQIHTVY